MSEYRVGRPVKGVVGIIVSVILLIYIPQIILNTVQDPYWLSTFLERFGIEFDATDLANMLSDFDTTGIEGLLERMIVSAVPLVVLAFPHKFFKEGSKGRLYTDLLRSVYCIARYFYIMNFGNLVGLIAITSGEQTMSVDVVLTGALLLAAFLKLLNIPKVIAIYKREREDFVDFHCEDGVWVNRSKKEIKELRKEKRENAKAEKKAEKRAKKSKGDKGRGSDGKDDIGEDDER